MPTRRRSARSTESADAVEAMRALVMEFEYMATTLRNVATAATTRNRGYATQRKAEARTYATVAARIAAVVETMDGGE